MVKLWQNLKRAVHNWMISELKQLCKEEWAKFLHNDVRQNNALIEVVQKTATHAIAAKGGPTSYWITWIN